MITRSHRAYGMNEYFRPTLEYVRAGRTRKNGHRFLSIRFLFLVDQTLRISNLRFIEGLFLIQSFIDGLTQ